MRSARSTRLRCGLGAGPLASRGNSDWLLPNRIYEASYFGCPSIALAGTETGRRVAADGLGFTVEEPTAEALTELLRGLTPEPTARPRPGSWRGRPPISG
jgi:hypothetical protein